MTSNSRSTSLGLRRRRRLVEDDELGVDRERLERSRRAAACRREIARRVQRQRMRLRPKSREHARALRRSPAERARPRCRSSGRKMFSSTTDPARGWSPASPWRCRRRAPRAANAPPPRTDDIAAVGLRCPKRCARASTCRRRWRRERVGLARAKLKATPASACVSRSLPDLARLECEPDAGLDLRCRSRGHGARKVTKATA